MTGQSHIASLAESFANVAIGYFVAVGAQIIIYPVFGINVSMGENLGLAAAFTVVSLIRSYVLRRVFNFLHLRAANEQ